jgi:hypothetical protein
MNDGCHEAENASGALKFGKGRPVGIESVKHFGMDRVGRAEALLVVSGAAFRRELLRLRPVEVVERAGDKVAGLELLLLDQWFEEATSHDLESLLGARGPPGGFHSPDTTLRRRSSASRPRWPPTSMSSPGREAKTGYRSRAD